MTTTASAGGTLPAHIGVIMDGNRRWARAAGMARVSAGHRAGADHLADLLRWLTVRGIHHASVYVLSADNIRKRDADEVAHLFRLVEELVPAWLGRSDEWQLHIAGDLGLLPASCAAALTQAVRATEGRRSHLTLAIGYDPKQSLVDAVRTLLADGEEPEGDALVQAIDARLPGGPIKDIDLVIRTSGERRISGFFPWQSQHAEIVFSDKMWPAFTESDLDAALAEYARRRAVH
ncbi:polyprenyl diphosphate synthase [Flexivirga oryzae]|uniref:Short-chain Z-isoprenyl diphosphate synthase n=1 Tax=Flexivirga oryzae TaxID=1794944 RepID=A0A839NFJ5_9MICO|nr:polyprenyl diphosphate synthase [Flexivirga oryzae]MBB2893915.1 short-chain Z-isoprenyl diphosphate synthase [Flexivirga oryzae]